MAHARKLLRDAVVAGISGHSAITALSPTPPVEAGRVIPLDDAKLPRILVYIRGEDATGDRISDSPRIYLVSADLRVEFIARVKAGEGPPEDELDAVAEAMEAAMDELEASRFNGLVRQARYQGTDVAIELDSSRTVVSIAFRYELQYGRAVSPALPNAFITTALDYLAGDAPADNPDDTVTLPQ